MALQKKTIKDASDDEIRTFGEEALGLNFTLNASREQLLALVMQADPGLEHIICINDTQVDTEGLPEVDRFEGDGEEEEGPTLADRVRAQGVSNEREGIFQPPKPKPDAVQDDTPVWTKPPAIFDNVKLRMGTGPAYKSDPLVVLMMQKTDEPGGERAVPLGCNGVVIQVPRGVLVALPFRYFLALQHTIRRVTTQDEKMNFIHRDVPSYPHTAKWFPPREEMREWLKRDARSSLPKDKQPQRIAA